MADIGSQIAGATTTAAPKTGKTTTKTKQVTTLTTIANIESQLYS